MMEEYINQTITKIQNGLTFQQWLDSLNTSQLEGLGNREDDDTGKTLIVLSLWFASQETGENEFSEEQIEEYTELMQIAIGCENNVRNGIMVRRGEAKITNSNAKYSITPAGKDKVKKMLGGS